jgi:hypothetical protein
LIKNALFEFSIKAELSKPTKDRRNIDDVFFLTVREN